MSDEWNRILHEGEHWQSYREKYEERINAVIEKKGTEFAQELADRMFEEEEITDLGYGFITNLVKEHLEKQRISF